MKNFNILSLLLLSLCACRKITKQNEGWYSVSETKKDSCESYRNKKIYVKVDVDSKNEASRVSLQEYGLSYASFRWSRESGAGQALVQGDSGYGLAPNIGVSKSRSKKSGSTYSSASVDGGVGMFLFVIPMVGYEREGNAITVINDKQIMFRNDNVDAYTVGGIPYYSKNKYGTMECLLTKIEKK